MFIDVALGFAWNWFACKVGWHKWDKFNGYYEERVAEGAHCKRAKCQAVYHG